MSAPVAPSKFDCPPDINPVVWAYALQRLRATGMVIPDSEFEPHQAILDADQVSGHVCGENTDRGRHVNGAVGILRAVVDALRERSHDPQDGLVFGVILVDSRIAVVVGHHILLTLHGLPTRYVAAAFVAAAGWLQRKARRRRAWAARAGGTLKQSGDPS